MDYLEASRRIADHLQVHKFKEQPRCEKITEALTLAVNALEQCARMSGVVAEYTGLPIECVHIPADAIVVLRFNIFEHDVTTVKRAFEGIKQEFPNCTVIALPKSLELDYYTRDGLAELKERLDSILEETAE